MLIIFGLNDVKKIFKNLSQNLRKVADKNKAMSLKNRKLTMILKKEKNPKILLQKVKFSAYRS